MVYMFHGASNFNQDLSEWDVSRVTDMSFMFYGAISFNRDLSKWNVSRVTNMVYMFYGASKFNQDLSKWNVSRVTDMIYMFYGASSFQKRLCGEAWLASKAFKHNMFTGSPDLISSTVCAEAPTTTVASTEVFLPLLKDELKGAIDECLELSSVGNCFMGPHGPIGEWDVSRITDMNGMFNRPSNRANIFNHDLSNWDVSHVTNMRNMFYVASEFNQDLSKWDVSRVTDMSSMFYVARSFNQDLSKWDVSHVTNMGDMFYVAVRFNHDLSKWDVSRVTNMAYMFHGASNFNQNLSKWDVSRVTNMGAMFHGASSFQQRLCGEAWLASNASKDKMFTGSHGSISRIVCALTTSRPDVTTTAKRIGLRKVTNFQLDSGIIVAIVILGAIAVALLVAAVSVFVRRRCYSWKYI